MVAVGRTKASAWRFAVLAGTELWTRLATSTRCRRCGLQLKRVTIGAHVRYNVDPDAWGRRCKALTPEGGPRAPNGCADLQLATEPPLVGVKRMVKKSRATALR